MLKHAYEGKTQKKYKNDCKIKKKIKRRIKYKREAALIKRMDYPSDKEK